MEQEEIFSTVRRLINKEIGNPKEEITLESIFDTDLSINSLEVLGIIMACEDEFRIEISDEDLEEVKTVAHIVNTIEALV